MEPVRDRRIADRSAHFGYRLSESASVPMNAKTLLILLLMCSGCTMVAEQQIEEDPARWVAFVATFDEGRVLYKSPPYDIHESQAGTKALRFRTGVPHVWIASMLYDYPSDRWSRPHGFAMHYSLAKIPGGVQASRVSIVEMAMTVARAINDSFHIETKERTYSVVTIGGTEWARSVDPTAPAKESYFRGCGASHVLLISPTYASGRGRKYFDWKRRRQSLAHRMLEQVSCEPDK